MSSTKSGSSSRKCSQCQEEYEDPKLAFSKNQLKKGPKAKCRTCIIDGPQHQQPPGKRKAIDEASANENANKKKLRQDEDQEDEQLTNAVIVEFKFTNYKTAAFWEGDVSGVMHVPMLQNPVTGRFKLGKGKTEVIFKVKRKHRMIKSGGSRYGRGPDRFCEKEFPEEEVTGTIYCDEKKKGGSDNGGKNNIKDFPLDYRLGWDYNNSSNEFVYCLKPEQFNVYSYNPTEGDKDELELKQWYRRNFGLCSSFTFACSPALSRTSPSHDYEFYTRRIKNWEINAGGELSFFTMLGYDSYDDPPFNMEYYAEDSEEEEEFQQSWNDALERATTEADYKLKLYTVLSAHRPDVIEETVAKEKDTTTGDEKKPADSAKKAGAEEMEPKNNNDNWGDELVRQVMARLDKDEAWSKRAVREYKHFLQLKIEHDDYESKKFSPSAKIDEIWHAHLSFTDRYQRDVRALSQNNEIIEHMPVLGEEPYRRYGAAYNAHKVRMEEKGTGEIDDEFWPNPKSISKPKPVNDEDSSGDELTWEEPQSLHPSCG